jgi:glutathione S-transferase
MSLQLFYHPLSSFSHKVLIALYENATPFAPRLLVREDPATYQQFKQLFPTGKMPLLRDLAHDRTIPETSIIIEYLQTFYPGPVALIPADPLPATQVRLWDRLFDLYVHLPMQKIVGDRLREPDSRDPAGVLEARAQLRNSYAMVEAELTLGKKEWIAGERFSMADCAAAPALFYADTLEPIGEAAPAVTAYLNRLMARPSYARALEEAEPYFHMYPLDPKPSRAPR